MSVALLGPNGVDSVLLANPNNKANTIDAGDLALDSFVKARVGTAGVLGFRNKIVDGRFDFWYEGVSQSSGGYGSDTMWYNNVIGSTHTHSQQTLTVGVDLPAIDCPTAKYFSRTVVTSVAGASNSVTKCQNIEGVCTLAGKTVTVSFYAKADAVKNIALTMAQVFGTGGSSLVNGIGMQLVSLSTTWKRYTAQITLPSISGKTVGTANDYIQLCFWFDAGSSTFGSILGQQSGTFDIACIQLEEGAVATQFEELPYGVSQQRVNRFYERSYNDSDATGTSTVVGSVQIQSPAPGNAGLLTQAFFKVSKRATPAVVVFSSEGTPNTTSTSAGQLAVNLQNVSCSGFTAGYNSGSSVYYLRFQYIADARL